MAQSDIVPLFARPTSWLLCNVVALLPPARTWALGRAAQMRWRPDGIDFERLTIDDRRLGALIDQGGPVRTVLLRESASSLSVPELAKALVDPVMERPVITTIAGVADSDGRSHWCRQTIQSAETLDPSQVGLALGVASKVADGIATDDARAILDYCLEVVAQPIGPYGGSVLAASAAEAAEALLRTHRELEVTLVDRCHGGPTDGIRAVAAAVVQARDDGTGVLFLEILKAWRPPSGRVAPFAVECDNRRSLGDAARTAQPLGFIWRQRLSRYAAWGWYVALLLIPASVLFVGDFHALAVVRRCSYVEAIAIVALLLAVHVVAAQLAATRLPSPLASGATQSPAITVGYVCALTVVVLTAMVPASGNASLQVSAALTFTGGLFFLSVVASAYALVRATDSVVAASAFVRARRWRYRRAGRRLGEFQQHGMECKAAAETLPYVRLEPLPSFTERRTDIRAQAFGYVDARAKRLRSLGTKPSWSDGHLTLRVTSVLATRIERGAAVASIVPDADTVVSRGDAKRIQRVFPIRRSPRIDEVSEAVAGLFALIVQEATGGDSSGASRVAEILCDMLLNHLDGALSRRELTAQPQADTQPIAPSVLALVTLVMNIKEAGPQVVPVQALVRRLLFEADPRERIAMAVAGRASRAGAELSLQMPLLLDCARRCLELQDRQGEALIRRVLQGAVVAGTPLTQIALKTSCELACLAPWLSYDRAPQIWRWYWEMLPDRADEERLVGAFSIGASALRAGHLSLATAVAHDANLHGLTLDTASEPVIGEAELRSLVEGRYLGDDVRGALTRYASFAHRCGEFLSQ